MVYEKNGYVRIERELIKRKTKAIKELEAMYKEIQLSFDIRTVYKKHFPWEDYEEWRWHKIYYEVSYLDENNEKTIVKFYARKGNIPLGIYLDVSMRLGGDEQECPTI